MSEVRVIEVKENILANNDRDAQELRRQLQEKKTFLLNLMSAPGSGKTSVLLRSIQMLKEDLRMGVMEADIDSAVDAEKIAETGTRAIQLHTGGMCHLDAAMTKQGLDEFDAYDLDLIVLENVGNLVCPAEFDTGACKSAMILSVPEGDDKPLKYPLMFSIVDAVLINKIDCAGYFDFNIELASERIKKLNPKAEIFPVSAKTGEGFEQWTRWLKEKTAEWNGGR